MDHYGADAVGSYSTRVWPHLFKWKFGVKYYRWKTDDSIYIHLGPITIVKAYEK